MENEKSFQVDKNEGFFSLFPRDSGKGKERETATNISKDLFAGGFIDEKYADEELPDDFFSSAFDDEELLVVSTVITTMGEERELKSFPVIPLEINQEIKEREKVEEVEVPVFYHAALSDEEAKKIIENNEMVKSRNIPILEVFSLVGIESPLYPVQPKFHMISDSIYESVSELEALLFDQEEVLEISFPPRASHILLPIELGTVNFGPPHEFDYKKVAGQCFGICGKRISIDTMMWSIRTLTRIIRFLWAEKEIIILDEKDVKDDIVKCCSLDYYQNVFYDVIGCIVEDKALSVKGREEYLIVKQTWVRPSDVALRYYERKEKMAGIYLDIDGVLYVSPKKRIKDKIKAYTGAVEIERLKSYVPVSSRMEKVHEGEQLLCRLIKHRVFILRPGIIYYDTGRMMKSGVEKLACLKVIDQVGFYNRRHNYCHRDYGNHYLINGRLKKVKKVVKPTLLIGKSVSLSSIYMRGSSLIYLPELNEDRFLKGGEIGRWYYRLGVGARTPNVEDDLRSQGLE
jgi:hypothetical protein